MRAICIRFKDCEGPGILEPLLRQNGYRVTYQNAYDHRIQLMPEIHQQFDLIVLLGGPQSVADPNLDEFFKPYYNLVLNALTLSNRKVIGICLGSQIIAKALGANVSPGNKGPEVGFSKVQILNSEHPIFKGISEDSITAYHLHEDVFDLPVGAELLLSSEMYANQMFSYKNRAFGFQTHLEPTWDMLMVWQQVHKEFISKGSGDFSDPKSKHAEMQAKAKIIFQNILSL